jgi:threonine dehydratase
MVESWRANQLIEHTTVHTIADGIAVRIPIPEAVKDMHGTVDDALLVSDESMLTAMKLLHHHLGLVVEPSGAVGIAAILERRDQFQDQLVATIICGGNVTPQQMTQWLA